MNRETIARLQARLAVLRAQPPGPADHGQILLAQQELRLAQTARAMAVLQYTLDLLRQASSPSNQFRGVRAPRLLSVGTLPEQRAEFAVVDEVVAIGDVQRDPVAAWRFLTDIERLADRVMP